MWKHVEEVSGNISQEEEKPQQQDLALLLSLFLHLDRTEIKTSNWH